MKPNPTTSFQTLDTQNQSDPTVLKGVPYILCNEFAERFGYYSIQFILIVFMTKHLFNYAGEPEFIKPQAMVWYHSFICACYLFSIVGALVADIFLGKYKTIIILSVVYCLGQMVLALFATKNALAVGLFLIAISVGGIKPSFTAHLGDQFDKQNYHLFEKVFSWFYILILLAAILAAIITPYLLETFNPQIAFLVPGILMLISTIIFYKGKKHFVPITPIGFKKYQKALQDKKNLKELGNLAIIFIFVSIFFVLDGQESSSFVIQAGKMDRQINLGFIKYTLAQSQVQVFDPLFTLIFILLLYNKIYPLLRKFIHLTYLKKIAVGFFFSSTAFIIAAIAQRSIEQGQMLNIIWQIWAYVFLACGKSLIIITSLEIAYVHAPRPMKSTSLALFYFLSISCGNFLSAFFNYVIQDSQGHQKITDSTYFWILAALGITTGIIFILYMPYYKRRVYFNLLRTSLPDCSGTNQARIKKVTDIILNYAKEQAEMIILSGYFSAKKILQYIDEKKEIEYASNYHFLVLTKNKKYANSNQACKLEKKIKQEFANQALEAVDPFDPCNEINVTIKPINDFIEEIEKKESILIKQEGILLYAGKKFKLPKSKYLTLEQQIAENKTQCQYCYNNGVEFLEIANILLKNNKINKAAYNLHQSVENFYHCCLLVLVGRKPQTHDLEELTSLLCVESNKFYEIFSLETAGERRCFDLLKRAYIESRYDQRYIITHAQVKYLITRLEKLKKVTKEICKNQVVSNDRF
jgi:POT family proton-dependent oligopeptide transporter